VLVTRDDCVYKPDPTPLLLACERLQVDRGEAWMVGDGPHDVQAGLAAHMRTVWLSHGRPRDFDEQPWREVRDLSGLHQTLRSIDRTRQL
jgi:FMN phosphatase YigB (HAD superfamily)